MAFHPRPKGRGLPAYKIKILALDVTYIGQVDQDACAELALKNFAEMLGPRFSL
jgi:hypothetical protein